MTRRKLFNMRVTGFIIVAIILLMLFLRFPEALASERAIPLKLNAEPREIDVTLPEAVNIVAKGGSTALDISDIEVVNNDSDCSIYIVSVSYDGRDALWELVPSDTDFTSMERDMNKFSLVADGVDLSLGDKQYSDNEILPLESYTINMEGSVGEITKPFTNVNVGSVVITITV